MTTNAHPAEDVPEDAVSAELLDVFKALANPVRLQRGAQLPARDPVARPR
ncbi:hypothetical protein F8568_013130 [Actinomadura sp. LD22]|uniref:Uncharacterized protein n=2 Tax=Actinomadura physcomitrii TaxID=2650748 RepID=A0A6I4MC07_9ACTN|nr:hypothetical protein [Actinomadura physcomitrii]